MMKTLNIGIYMLLISCLSSCSPNIKVLRPESLNNISTVGLAPTVYDLVSRKGGFDYLEISNNLLLDSLTKINSFKLVKSDSLKKMTLVEDQFELMFEHSYLQNLKNYNLDAIIIYKTHFRNVGVGSVPHIQTFGTLTMYEGKSGNVLIQIKADSRFCGQCRKPEEAAIYTVEKCLTEFMKQVR